MEGDAKASTAEAELVLNVLETFSVSTLQTAPCGMWAAKTRNAPHPAVKAAAAWDEFWARQLGAVWTSFVIMTLYHHLHRFYLPTMTAKALLGSTCRARGFSI